MRPARIFIARPCGFMSEHPDVGTYMMKLGHTIASDKRFSLGGAFITNQARILDARNSSVRAAGIGPQVEEARRDRADYLYFFDPDMQIDCELFDPDIPADRQPHARTDSLPFFQTSMQFLLERWARREKLAIVGAPACAGGPHYKTNVFGTKPNGETYNITRKEAATRFNTMEKVMAIGTGAMIIPMEVFNIIPPPYFDDHYEDRYKTNVHFSQDTNFCFTCHEYGIEVYCNWYNWAGHWKDELVRRPEYDPLELL